MVYGGPILVSVPHCAECPLLGHERKNTATCRALKPDPTCCIAEDACFVPLTVVSRCNKFTRSVHLAKLAEVRNETK